MVDPSAPHPAIARPLAETPEQFALCTFFTQFVIVPSHPDGQRGFLECLLPLYTAARHDSLLSVATSAVALSISGGHPWRRADYCLGRLAFGRALRMVAAAIQDPLASTEDETLMAVLLLGFYEVSADVSVEFERNVAVTQFMINFIFFITFCNLFLWAPIGRKALFLPNGQTKT